MLSTVGLCVLLLFYDGATGYRIIDEQTGRAERNSHKLMDAVGDVYRGQYVNDNNEARAFEEALEHWTGRWMPDNDPKPTPAPQIYANHLEQHVAMGKSMNCDDGQSDLEVDWDHSPVNYTCYGRKIIPDYQIEPSIYCEHVPAYYHAAHACMKDRIEYDDDIPTYGTHRPVWPVYGEYKFVPRQRWLHSLEHGGLVMLYHPCANPLEVKRLKSLVQGCLRRHIITPYSLLSEDKPLALLTWGCRLTMSYVNPTIVQRFIREKALRGPEAVSRDGEFSDGLMARAKIVTDMDDTTLCPQL